MTTRLRSITRDYIQDYANCIYLRYGNDNERKSKYNKLANDLRKYNPRLENPITKLDVTKTLEPYKLGFPARSIRRAIVKAATSNGEHANSWKTTLYIQPIRNPNWLVPIDYKYAFAYTTIIRTIQRADFKCHVSVKNWSTEFYLCKLPSRYISYQKCIDMLQYAGDMLGIGGDRAEHGGTHGSFEVIDARSSKKKNMLRVKIAGIQDSSYEMNNFSHMSISRTAAAE